MVDLNRPLFSLTVAEWLEVNSQQKFKVEKSEAAEVDKLMTLEDLINYLPEKPAKQTVYGWINNRTIPYEKHGRRVYFRKSSIDNWLNNGRQMKGL